MAERKLGRGLEALLGRRLGHAPDPVPVAAPHTTEGGDTVRIPPAEIKPNPFQPRQQFPEEALQSLAESIERHGMLQPIIVRRAGEGYELVAGERRWRAALHLGLDSVPAVVRQADDTEMLLVALIENVQREDLNAIDRAKAYRELCERFGLTQEEAAAQLGIDRASLSNYVRLLDLPQEVQDLVAGGQLSMGHARAILSTLDAARRLDLARRTVRDGLSVRQVEALVAERPRRERVPPAKTADPNIRSLEEQLMERLGTRVSIVGGRRKHSGRILIEFYTNDDFERIFDAIVK